MNIEHKIREILRSNATGRPLTAKEIFESGQFENLTVIQATLQKMASRTASGIAREKIKNPEKRGLPEIWAYFSTDKDAPATSKTAETLNLSSKPVEKQEVKRIAEAAPEPKDIPPVIPEIKHTPEPAPDYPGAHKPKKFYVMGHDDYPSLDDAVAAARDIAVKNPGETIEVWEAAMLHRFRAKVEVEEVS